MQAPELLDRAAGHMRDRAAIYDKPEGERSMAQTVAIFNLHHGTALTEAMGWHFMQVLKDVRLFTRDEYHADSAEDGIAYCALKAEALARAGRDPRDVASDPEGVLVVKAGEPLKAVPAGDGWISWSGGSCPVSETTRVHFRTPCNGGTFSAFAGALEWRWLHDLVEDGRQITDYRIAPDNGI